VYALDQARGDVLRSLLVEMHLVVEILERRLDRRIEIAQR